MSERIDDLNRASIEKRERDLLRKDGGCETCVHLSPGFGTTKDGRRAAGMCNRIGGVKFPGDTCADHEAFEVMTAGDDGWSEWIHPLPGYLMKCCDCGLIHELQVAIGERDGDGPLNEGEGDNGVVIFRMRRRGGRDG